MRADETLRDDTVRLRIGRSGLKDVRLDKPFDPPEESAAGVPPPSQTARLVRLLRRAMGTSPPAERRGSVRHPVTDPELFVGWWRGEDFGATAGRLLDLSRGGARVVLDDRPPRRQPVWLYKEVDETLAFVRGDVVATTPAPGGAFTARVRFAFPCPTLLCQALICGDGHRARRRRPG